MRIGTRRRGACRARGVAGAVLLGSLGLTGTLAVHAVAHPAMLDGGGAACPPDMERPCPGEGGSQGGGSGGDIPQATCVCGSGHWVRETPVVTSNPATAIAEINQVEKVNGTAWVLTRAAHAEAGGAFVHVAGRGTSHFWRAGSMTRSASAQYTSVGREYWVGDGVPCPRPVSLAATGGGGMTLTLTCSAAPGCGASGTASVSATCSSLGRARAHLDNKQVTGSVAYNAMSTKMDVRGNFGVEYNDNSATIQGRAQRDVNWSLQGSGNVSGSATYSVREECTYCAFTNRALTRRANGMAVCSGGATVDDNGSASFDVRAYATLTVN